jgi:hypothetical protein
MSPSKVSSHLPQASTPQTPGGGHFGSLQQSTPKGFLTPGNSQLRTPATDKPGGPPTSGLFSTPKFGTPKQLTTPRGGFGTPRAAYGGTPVPTTPQMSFGATPVHNVSSVREEIFNASR